MALFHFNVTQVKRSEGQSAIASAAYRSGEKLYSERYGEYSDYTRKGGVICTDILLPPHVPPEFADRQTLWNAVEKVERGKKAQLAYSFEISMQNEFSLEENMALTREFLQKEFVSRGHDRRPLLSREGDRRRRHTQPAFSFPLSHPTDEPGRNLGL